MVGSMIRATSPGSVVPPPRPVSRLSEPVALPASTAAAFLNIGVSRRGEGARHLPPPGGPAVESLDRRPRLRLGLSGLEERRTASSHPPPGPEPARELLQARFDALSRTLESMAFDLVPRRI